MEGGVINAIVKNNIKNLNVTFGCKAKITADFD